MSVLWPGCGSVSGAFQLCRSHMGGGTCVRPPHSQPEERIVIIRQEEANPMKTVATLLAGSRNGEADVGGGKSSPK